MKTSIPFFSLKRQWNNVKENIESTIHKLLKSNQFIGGPYVEEFEKQFTKYIQCTHCISCNSGTDALWLALKALNTKPNSLILTTPFSFIASSSEIIAHNAHPVFIDIDEKTYNICPQKIEHWLKLNATIINKQATHKQSGKTIQGMIIVNLFGQGADYNAIKLIANKWNLWIIEDACQSIGAHINKQKTGNFGDISCFSFYPTKNLGIFGDGGTLTTNNATLAEKLFQLRNHGRKNHYEYEFYGKNSRLDAIQAAIATEKLKLIDSFNNRRREIANCYSEKLSNIPFIKIPQEKIGYHVYHQYCIQLINNKNLNIRNELREYLTNNNIGTNIFYPKGLHQISFLNKNKQLKTDCSITEKATQNILALPIWPELKNQEINLICSHIKKFFTNQKQD